MRPVEAWSRYALALMAVLVPACSPATALPAPPEGIWEGQTYDGAYAIDVDLPQATVDTPVAIRVTGLRPGQPVTLRARMELRGRAWTSWATFAADTDGTVDVGRLGPLHGTYAGADPVGLLWSMVRVGSATATAGTVSHEPLRPLVVTLTAEAKDQILASHEIERLFYDPARVTRQVVEHERIVATLFRPRTPGPHPTIVCLGGSEGGLSEGYAALLASHGYVTMALAYFGVDPLPQQLIEIPLEYAVEGIDWLAAQPAVDADHLALLGGSKGAELALLLAATYPERIDATVAYKPSSVVWMGLYRSPQDNLEGPRSSWTLGGEPLPFLRGRLTLDLVKVAVGRPAALRSSYAAALQDSASVAEAVIPVERIQCPVLLISGADDQMWPSAEMGQMVMDRLDKHGASFSHEHLVYEGAGHGIAFPFVPTTQLDSGTMMSGGSAAGTAAANNDAWLETLTFLQETLH